MVDMEINRSIDMSNTINTAITNWSTDGRSQFNELYKKLFENDKDKFEAELAIKQILLSLCKSCLQGNQPVETIIRIFSELQEIVSTPTIIGDLLADIFATLDIELFPNDDTTPKEVYKQRFFQLINNSEHIVPTSLLMERLEIDTLEYLDLIVSREQFNQKYVRIKTRLYYKQQKFNLLREESEGFSKTITELNQNFSITKLTSEQLYDRLMALIGYFDIDPNRMLDLVLEAFEYHLEYTKIYVDLLHLLHFDQITICQLIGFKFQQYQLQDETADSLYLLAAQLISNNLIELEDLLPHLYPLITDFSDNYTKDIENIRSSKKSLTSTSNDSNGKTKESNVIKSNNQLLHLIQSLLYIGDLDHALFLLNNLPRWSCTSYREINTLLTKILAYIIDPLYKSNSDVHSCFLQYELVNPLNSNIYPRDLNLIKTWEEFRESYFPLLLHLGAFCQDRLLFMKLTRICTHLIKQSSNTDDQQQQEDILSLIDEVLLPSLSLLDVNGCLAIELWTLIKLFPYDIRYGLYGQWHEDTYRKTSQLIFIKQDVIDKSRAILRRITKDNVKTYSRQIAKMTHNNPIIILSVIVDQIQRFDNFISVINDALKYLSPLAYDILCYTILRVLTTPTTSLPAYIDGKMSRENATPAQWFQNICVLSANVFKKYPIDFTSVLYYIYDQLRVEKTYDLYLLREIITKMSGVEVASTITREQLEAASGGELLRNEAGQFTAARNVKKPSIRLKEALLDNHLYLPLSIIIAQQRSCIVFKFGAQKIEHLKLIGSLYDQCQDTMVQFYTFLSNVLTTENFHHKFPSIDDLVLGFHLQVDAAFHISRPLFNLNIQAKFDELRASAPKSSNKTALIQNYIDAVTMVMSPVLDFVKTLHSQRTWEEMTPQFYLTFWSLSMSDLQVPEAAYKRRVEVLELEMTQIDGRKELTAAKKRKEKEKIHIIIDKLNEELVKQKEHVERVRARLEIESGQWFKNRNRTKAETITEFLQLCIFPRCLLSEIDALYCAHFIRVIHDLVTPNFSTIICYDRLFSDISYSLASCSENEAIRYGRFLQSLLETVMSWHNDRNKFDKECATHPGFLTVFRNAGSSASKATGTTQTPEQLDYDNFRHVCHKWHYKLAKSFIVCLDSNDYIQIRNVLQVLTVLLPIYPKMITFYTALERRIKNICLAEKDRRHDLFALAKCYSGRLAHKHRDMIEEGQFHTVPERSTTTSNNNNTNNPGTNMTPLVTPTIGDTNNDKHHPILSDNQSATTTTNRSSASKDSSNSNSSTRSTSEKPMNVSGTNNGSTTAQKSSSPAPSSTSQSTGSTSTNNTERSTTKVKSEPSTNNSSTNPTPTSSSSTKTNRIPHGPSLPSSKTSVTSTTQNKNESSDVSNTTSGRTIKMSNNGTDRHESPQASTVSTTHDSPPSNRKDTVDRRQTSSSTTDQQQSSSKSSSSPSPRTTSSRTVTSSTRNTSSVATNNDDSSRRSDQTATNGTNNPSSSTSSKTTRTESPHEPAQVEKRSRGSSSKGDRVTASHGEESRNGSSRSTHREHKHETTKRPRSLTPDKRSSNVGNGSSSTSSSRRSNQTAESTTPTHQENENNNTSGVMDVSPTSLSTKRIKTSDTVSNGRSTRREGREDRHASSSSSHRGSSSTIRSERRDKHHPSKETK